MAGRAARANQFRVRRADTVSPCRRYGQSLLLLLKQQIRSPVDSYPPANAGGTA